jgi:spermidine synthase
LKNALAIACFIASGFAGLVYEICWIRMASLVFGSTIFALSTVLAIFFTGLAGGSYLFGRLALRLERPLRLYGILEISLAILALASPLVFRLLDGLYGPLYRALADGIGALFVARFVLVSVALLPPTLLMGGTLPLFCRQFVVRQGRIAGSIGFLYGANTLGAALGCAVTGFWLLPHLGVRGSLAVGAAVSIVAGLVVVRLPLKATPIPASAGGLASAPVKDAARTTASDAAGALDRRRRLVMGGLFFLTGLVALGAEVLWTRFLALIVRNSVTTYTITLTVVLTGIVLGSLLATRLFDRSLPRAFCFGALQILTGLSVLALMLLPVGFWRGLGQGPGPFIVLMLAPAVFSGAVFPLANRIVLGDPALAARSVGHMAALNTFGGIVGSLAVGFVALPRLGLEPSLLLISGASLVSGLLAWLWLEDRVPKLILLGLAALSGAAWFLLPSFLGTRLPADFLAPREQLVDFREGYGSSLAVVRRKGALHLEIDRLWQGKDQKSHQIMAAHVPMLVHPSPRDVLVVGVGTGQTASRFLMYDIARLDCVDIEPAIFDFVAKNFDSAWMRDRRVQLIKDDGRNTIAHTDRHYDVISIEVGQLFRPGVETFYTEEFYREAKERLLPQGILVQFVPLPFFDEEGFRRVLGTFLDVFPEAILWYNTSELLLLGRKPAAIAAGAEHRPGPGWMLDPARVNLIVTDPAIHADLCYNQWGGRQHWLNQLEVFLGGFLCGPRELAALADRARPFRDDLPELAYATSGVEASQRNEVPIVSFLGRYLSPLAEVWPLPLAEDRALVAARMRDQNLADLVCGAYLRTAEIMQVKLQPARIIDLLAAALQWNGDSNAAHRMMGDLRARVGQLEEARQSYGQALQLQDDDALSRRGLGYVLLQQGRSEEAAAQLMLALKRMPADAATHNYLGAALATQGRLPEAVRHFETALRLRPRDEDIRRNLERAREAMRH